MVDAGERTILEVARQDLRPFALMLGLAGFACVVVDLAAPWHSLSPVTMVGFLLWFGMAGLLAAAPVVLVRADASGVRVGAHPAVSWGSVAVVVLVRREVLLPSGPESAVFLVLASSPVTDLDPLNPVLSDDPRVLLAQPLPAALSAFPAPDLTTRLSSLHPDVIVIDHR